MTLTCLADVQSKLCNANLSDEEAQQLIDWAVEQAAVEVYSKLSHARNVEKDLYNLRRERDRNQQMKSESERLRLEKERQESLARTAELRAAENLNGPRRGHSGSGW